MAVGELYITQTAEDTVALDLSPNIARLASDRSAYGVGYAKTLTALGFSQRTEGDGWEPTLVVEGTLETARARLPDLRREIGTIAQSGAAVEVSFPGYNAQSLQEIIDKLTTQTLPELAPDAPLSGVAFAIAYPFAKSIMTNGVRGHINHCVAPWRATETELAVQKKKEALFGTLACIPLRPALSPEDELAELNARPDQTTWWERYQAATFARQEQEAISFLRSRGFNVEPVPSDGVA